MHKCKFPDGVVIKPDGVNELDPCMYTRREEHRNATVYIDQCVKCGHIIISWVPQKNTESTIHSEMIKKDEQNNIIRLEIEEIDEEEEETYD